MADNYIIGGIRSGKSYMTLNTIEVLLENKKLKEALKAKEQECKELKKQVDITQMFLDACNNSCEHYTQTLEEIKKDCRNKERRY